MATLKRYTGTEWSNMATLKYWTGSEWSVACDSGTAIPDSVVDNFEDGGITDWNGYSGYSVTSSRAADGTTYSLSFEDDGTRSELYKEFGPVSTSWVRFYVYPTDGVNHEVVLSDGSSSSDMGAVFFTDDGIYWGDRGDRRNGTELLSSAAEQWYMVDLKNIDYGAGTLDGYVGGTEKAAGMPFVDSPSQLSRITLACNQGSNDGYEEGGIDEIYYLA